ncbi:MAG: hypothetical protein SGJ19_23100, partial [Planctomycetia bacterium]|nr:hypothetical protein [Planctomycetia bacterium]
LVHDLKLVLGQWSVNDAKSNEPAVLRQRLPELFQNFPLLHSTPHEQASCRARHPLPPAQR